MVLLDFSALTGRLVPKPLHRGYGGLGLPRSPLDTRASAEKHRGGVGVGLFWQDYVAPPPLCGEVSGLTEHRPNPTYDTHVTLGLDDCPHIH